MVPYIQLVFGIECALRGLRRTPFPARGKYDVAICLVVIVLMLVATWIPAQVRLEMDYCFGSLMWFITRHGRSGLFILSFVAVFSIFTAITIFFRLVNTVTISQRQRIAASRMVYYLVLSVVSLVSLMDDNWQNWSNSSVGFRDTLVCHAGYETTDYYHVNDGDCCG